MGCAPRSSAQTLSRRSPYPPAVAKPGLSPGFWSLGTCSTAPHMVIDWPADCCLLVLTSDLSEIISHQVVQGAQHALLDGVTVN